MVEKIEVIVVDKKIVMIDEAAVLLVK